MRHLPVIIEEPVPDPGPIELLRHDALEGVAQDGAIHVPLHGAAHEQVDVVHALVQVLKGVYTLECKKREVF